MNRQQAFFLVVTSLTVAVAAMMVLPYLQYLLAGVLLAFVTRPVYLRLAERVPRSVAAGLVVFLTIVVVVVPVLLMIGAVADQAASIAGDVSLEALPNLQELERQIEELTGQSVDLESRLRAALEALGGWATGVVSGLVGAAVGAMIGITMMLLVQFYAVRDWDRFADWTKGFDLLPTHVLDRVYESSARATWSMVKGHVFIAIMQGVAAGVGLWVAGVPDAVFWTFMMVVLGFIPMIGAMFVWGPAGIYLLATGSVLPGVALLVYGFAVMLAFDNAARPLLVDEDVDLNDVFVLLGVIGGMSVFGPVGLFVGPVVLAVLGTLLDLYKELYTDLDPEAGNREWDESLMSYSESESE